MIYLRAIGDSIVVYYLEEYGKEEGNGILKTWSKIASFVNCVATTTEQFKISGPEDIAAFSRSVLLDNSREQFIAIYLEGSHNVAAYSLISIGSANCTTVHPREVFQRAVLVGAVSIVISHNHPSGKDTPSQEDLSMTKRLLQSADILGIKLLDHVIVSSDN